MNKLTVRLLALRILPLWLTMLPLVAVHAVSRQNWPYSVRYDRGHMLFRNGQDFAVVDVDVEWPEAIDSVEVNALQRKICTYVFHTDTTNYDAACAAWLQAFGRPVVGKLDSLPDDRRFTYVQASAVVKSHTSRRWIAYDLKCDVSPGQLSTYKKLHRRMVVVYDLATHSLFTPEDMINSERLLSGGSYSDILDSLYAPLDDKQLSTLSSSTIVGIWPDNQHIGVQMLCRLAGQTLDYSVQLSSSLSWPCLTKPVRRMLRGEVCASPAYYAQSDSLWHGEPVVLAPDVLPVYPGGQPALRQYVLAAAHGLYSLSGQVLVSFIVDGHGQVQRVRVVRSGGPELDRLAASIVLGMPAWQPGKLLQRVVPVRMTLPFFFR